MLFRLTECPSFATRRAPCATFLLGDRRVFARRHFEPVFLRRSGSMCGVLALVAVRIVSPGGIVPM